MEKLLVPLALTIEEVNVVLAALSERPLKDVLDLFDKIKDAGDQVVQGARERAQVEASHAGQAALSEAAE